MTMTKEDKQLLLQDLCARLPYGVFCVGITYELDDDGEKYIPVKVKNTLTEIHNYKLETAYVRLGLISSCELETVKPYLRPMSSMAEEERKELNNNIFGDSKHPEYFTFSPNASGIIYNGNDNCCCINIGDSTIDKLIDWLLEHHFDFRGLIEKGLAISTEEFNPYKKERN